MHGTSSRISRSKTSHSGVQGNNFVGEDQQTLKILRILINMGRAVELCDHTLLSVFSLLQFIPNTTQEVHSGLTLSHNKG